MTFQELKIAAGYDNTAGLTNLESIKVNDWYFTPFEDLGKWNEGVDVIRGDGVIIPQGYASTSWLASSLHLDQWKYLFETVLSGNRSGKVTFATRRYQRDIYKNFNGILTIPPQTTLKKTNVWFEDVILTFTRVRTIGGFDSGFDFGFDVYEG